MRWNPIWIKELKIRARVVRIPILLMFYNAVVALIAMFMLITSVDMAEIRKNQPLIIQVLGMEEQAVKTIKACPYVKKLSLENKSFTVLFDGNDEEEAELLSALIQGKVPVQRFYRETGDLESRFLDLIS